MWSTGSVIYYTQTANKQLERKQICQNDIFISHCLVQTFTTSSVDILNYLNQEIKIGQNLPMAYILNIQI